MSVLQIHRGLFMRRRKKVCYFCTGNIKKIDWKKVDFLKRYVMDNGTIRPRQKTGTCAKHQRQLATAIKRARYVALLPYTTAHARFSGFGNR
ncbi:MAG: 30S ribosomal protein S18 [Anaerolineaceae bacterium 4572_78]|nr:MAG: 30S ribosomal protein S18 [Anaerolineaceae bacterium 4572_78]